jgi:hypothetical protein
MPSRNTKPRSSADRRLRANLPAERRSTKTKTRFQQLVDGDITVDDLDEEEIMMNRVKDKNGHFTGRPRDLIPRKISDQMRRRWLTLVQEKLNDQTELAVATLQDVMASRMAAAPARVRAAEIILERNLGKVPDKVQQTIELKPFEENIEGLLVDADESNVYQITTAKATKEEPA